MWLIGIDEAGYGPKLGPLVIAATAWHREHAPPSSEIDFEQIVSADKTAIDPFREIATPVQVGDSVIRVDDSKQVFRGGSLRTLNRVFSVAQRFCGRTESTLAERLPTLLAQDHHTIAATAWLRSLLDPAHLPIPLASAAETQAAIEQWGRCQWKLRDVAARMIDARAFNQYCGGGERVAGEVAAGSGNKSDLLGEMSIRLAADLLDSLGMAAGRSAAPQNIQVFFDRHGGRRYYAGVIQQYFDCEPVRILSESKTQSVYETVRHGHPVRLHFTVKGDRHVPVALSSLHAKYLREVAMASLNDYFRAAFSRLTNAGAGQTNSESVFRPTAGYPVDADRFIEMIRPVMTAEGIADAALIRCR